MWTAESRGFPHPEAFHQVGQGYPTETGPFVERDDALYVVLLDLICDPNQLGEFLGSDGPRLSLHDQLVEASLHIGSDTPID